MLIFDELRKNDAPIRNVALIVICGMVTLVVGLWYVQVASAERFVEKEIGQSFRTVRIPAVRGKILDRNGIALAEDRSNYNISLYLDGMRPMFAYFYTNVVRPNFRRSHPGVILKGKQLEELEWQSRALAVSNATVRLGSFLQTQLAFDEREFRLHFERRPVLPMPVVLNATSKQIARFEESPVLKEGLDLDAQPTRVYPYGQLAAPVLGHLTHDDSSAFDEESFFNYRLDDYRGVVGLEKAFDQELRGKAGVKRVQVNRLGYRQHEYEWTRAEPGRNLVLTLDARVQKAAEDGLRSRGKETQGAVVVMDALNGDLWAMASSPTYDPNIFVRRLSQEDMAYLNDEDLTPQINRATQGAYNPGSIFKIITGLAAMEARVLDPHEIYHSPGVYPIGKGIRDTAGAGDFDYFRAFIKSSNCYFIEYGLKAGLGRIQEMGGRFHLGEPAGLASLGQEVHGDFPSPEWIEKRREDGENWSRGNTANLCIGQEVTVTPIQMAVMVAAVANGGTVVWPRLVQRLEPQEKLPNQENITAFPSEARSRINVNATHLEWVREAMFGDVEVDGGTAYLAFHPTRKESLVAETRVAGKTGTAQVTQGRKVLSHVTWFASFGILEEHPFVVVVMVDHGSSGGGTCAPVAVKVYQEIERMHRLARSRGAAKGELL